MSEEEKQAIDTLQNCIADYVIGDFCVGKYCPQEDACKNDDCPFEKAIDTVINLIDKQQKEIEELKNINKKLNCENQKLFGETIEQQKEIAEKNYQLKIKNEYLQLAHDIAFDYDGCNTTESLKSLIDEIVELINKAYKNDDNSIIYIGGNSRKFNILHREIENE